MTKYTVEAWWHTTRQATTQIEAESVEQAVEIARRMVNESDPFIENNKDCYDDGPTNLTIWDAAMAQQLAEAPSKEQRLSEAAPKAARGPFGRPAPAGAVFRPPLPRQRPSPR